MTHTHRIALLEDSNRQLEKLQSYLSTIPHVDLVLKCSNSEDLLVEAQTVHPEILVTDLKLLNDSMNGLEVAEDLKIPVMFIGDVKEYVREIENLKRDADICVDHITKPFSEEQFVKSFKRFLHEVNFFSPPQYVHLDFNKKKHKVDIKIKLIIILKL